MTSKELLYIDDTLGHLELVCEYLDSVCDCLEDDANDLIMDIKDKNQKMFDDFMKLIK